jgi:hypothetical protein
VPNQLVRPVRPPPHPAVAGAAAYARDGQVLQLVDFFLAFLMNKFASIVLFFSVEHIPTTTPVGG